MIQLEQCHLVLVVLSSHCSTHFVPLDHCMIYTLLQIHIDSQRISKALGSIEENCLPCGNFQGLIFVE